jgi:AcrR family transcriptional regulator
MRPAARGEARGRRPSHSVESIVAAAIEVLDEEGTAGLSMRRVAERLGTGAASLYNYISNREQLLELVFDELVSQVPLLVPDPHHWRDQVIETLGSFRRVLVAHRDAALAGMGRIPTSVNTLRASENLVATLRAGGLSDRAVALGFDQLILYVCADALEESVLSNSGMDKSEVADYYAQVHAFFHALPAADFPVLGSIAEEMTSADGDERFAFGLEVLLSGLEAMSSKESSGQHRRTAASSKQAGH